MSEELIDEKDVIDSLQDVVDEVAGKKKPEPTPEPKPEPKPDPKPEPAVRGQDDTALQVAWSLVEDHVQETCPDLDEEMRGVARDAAGGSPVKFKEIAKKMQAKVAAKKGTAETDEEKQKRELAEKVFGDGAPGGDANVAKQKPAPTAEEKLTKAVEKGDSRGILGSVVQNINDKKLFQRGVSVIIE